jgi:hypothetical protein
MHLILLLSCFLGFGAAFVPVPHQVFYKPIHRLNHHIDPTKKSSPPTNTTIFVKTNPIRDFAKYSGFYVGIPMSVLSSVFLYNHYHQVVLDGKLILFNFLVGMYTYGNDHLQDAIESSSDLVSPKKAAMYAHLITHQDLYRQIYGLCYDACLLLLLEQGNAISFHSIFFYFVYELIKFTHNLRQSFLGGLIGQDGVHIRFLYTLLVLIMYQSHWFDHDFLVLPFLVALDSTSGYRVWKRANPLWKPLYIGAMWTMVTVVLPVVLYQNSYGILLLDHPAAVLSPMFLMMGASNMLDIVDIEEDRAAGIRTLPVVMGERIGQLVGVVCYFMALLFFVVDGR